MADQVSDIKNIYEQSIFIFLEMARYQFFYDVNKRMGLFIMNANLLQHGYPVINVSATRQLEFNQKMLSFYNSHEHKEMAEFMLSCIDGRTIQIMGE